ncbi:MAG: hypothetical protein RLZZ46_868 [Bacteroidota bacterium]|jgi:copper chaperone CopZ
MRCFWVFLLLFFLECWTSKIFAQSSRKWATDSIKTSAHCEFCKKDIETALKSFAGLKKCNVDWNRGTILITYNKEKTCTDSVRYFLSRMGYDADSVPAKNKILQRRSDPCFKRID